MPDTQIAKLAVKAAPADFVLPDGVEFILKAVNASFTDVGSTADWLPALVILSDSGHVIARAADQAVKVVGGVDAEVSWFRGVKNGGGAAAGQQGYSFEADTGFNNQSIPDSAATFVTFNRVGRLYKENDSNSSPYFTAPGSGGGGNPYPRLTTSGYYLAAVQTFWTAGVYDRYCAVAAPTSSVDIPTMETLSSGAINGVADNRVSWFGPFVANLSAAGGYPLDIGVVVYQTSGAPLNLQRAVLNVVRLGDFGEYN